MLVKKIIAGIIFAILAAILATQTPTIEITWVSALLLLTIYLFTFEVVGEGDNIRSLSLEAGDTLVLIVLLTF